MTTDSLLDVPVALILFNRPELTGRVFEQIAKVRPCRLYLIADGPRPSHPEDVLKCEQARNITQSVNWDCQVIANFSDQNLGVKARVSSGISALFAVEDRAIILEDDCVPDPTFFYFCRDLLCKYQHDPRVMMIGGTNYQFGHNAVPWSYYFSIYPHIWGWATWASAWEHYDGDMQHWPEVKKYGLLSGLFPNPRHRRFWERRFQFTYDGRLDTWDYCWTLACWRQNGLAIVPTKNLVKNIGFGDGATHTLGRRSRWSNQPTAAMTFPLIHPPNFLRHTTADAYTQTTVFREHRLAPLKRMLKMWFSKHHPG